MCNIRLICQFFWYCWYKTLDINDSDIIKWFANIDTTNADSTSWNLDYITPQCIICFSILPWLMSFLLRFLSLKQVLPLSILSMEKPLLKSSVFFFPLLSQSFFSFFSLTSLLQRYLWVGLGQVQLKLGDFKSSLASFEKVLEVYPENCECLKVDRRNILFSWNFFFLILKLLFWLQLWLVCLYNLKAVGHIYVQLGQNEKALEIFRKAARIDPRDPQVKQHILLTLYFLVLFLYLHLSHDSKYSHVRVITKVKFFFFC